MPSTLSRLNSRGPQGGHAAGEMEHHVDARDRGVRGSSASSRRPGASSTPRSARAARCATWRRTRHRDVPAFAAQPPRQVRPDESAGAGDQARVMASWSGSNCTSRIVQVMPRSCTCRTQCPLNVSGRTSRAIGRRRHLRALGVTGAPHGRTHNLTAAAQAVYSDRPRRSAPRWPRSPHCAMPPISKSSPSTSRRERKQFFNLPWDLYRGDPNWMPPIRIVQKELLELQASSVLRRRGDSPLPGPARRQARAAGVAAIVNHAHNRWYHEQRGFFGFFESIDDQEVAGRAVRRGSSLVRRATASRPSAGRSTRR